MKWIKDKDGDLVNIDRYDCIEIYHRDAHTKDWAVRVSGGGLTYILFESTSEKKASEFLENLYIDLK